MNTDSYNNFSNSFNSYGNPKARRNSAYSMKSNSSKNSKKTTNIKQRKKSFSKLGKNDNYNNLTNTILILFSITIIN